MELIFMNKQIGEILLLKEILSNRGYIYFVLSTGYRIKIREYVGFIEQNECIGIL